MKCYANMVLPSNTRLGWKLLRVADTLTYNCTKLITTVKGFIVQALECQMTIKVLLDWCQDSGDGESAGVAQLKGCQR
jgi:hypothetical protein